MKGEMMIRHFVVCNQRVEDSTVYVDLVVNGALVLERVLYQDAYLYVIRNGTEGDDYDEDGMGRDPYTYSELVAEYRHRQAAIKARG